MVLKAYLRQIQSSDKNTGGKKYKLLEALI